MKKIRNVLLDIFYPPRCPVCGAVIPSGENLCEKCKGKRLDPFSLCFYCGKPFDECLCAASNYDFDGVTAVFRYEDVRTGILKLKFHRARHAGVLFGVLMAESIADRMGGIHFDGILCVPISEERRRERGYNQSRVLLEQIAERMGIAVLPDVLQKCRSHPPLSKTQSAAQRARLLRGSFEVTQKDAIKGKTILLVDDVLTTGATLSEVSRILKKAGAERVYAAVTATVCKKI